MAHTNKRLIGWSEFHAQDALSYLAPPKPDDDKYSRGVLGIMTGSPSFSGAAVLGVEGASRTGVGMVRYLGPQEARCLVLHRRPEAVTVDGQVQAWLIGSGIDAEQREDSVTEALVNVLKQGKPAVVDAGALDLLSYAVGPVVATPHYGELVHLFGVHGIDVTKEDVASDPAAWAVRAAELLGVTVLLKGHTSYIAGITRATQDTVREEERFTVTAPTTELATAGSGDVLAGILGAILATHHAAIEANPSVLPSLAATAAFLHGAAGKIASRGGPISALDIASAVPATIATLRRE